ncbi:hypothetical protein GW17_00029933 [Ensete ventricosum]|nr:hypothetical protein GW17_00029933 [Ensete ventricosum]
MPNMYPSKRQQKPLDSPVERPMITPTRNPSEAPTGFEQRPVVTSTKPGTREGANPGTSFLGLIRRKRKSSSSPKALPISCRAIFP